MVAANLRLITATISVDGEDYTTHIQDFSHDPAAVSSEITDVSGKVVKFSGESGWTTTLNVFQDFTATGFARKCLDDEGEKVTLVVVDGPVTWTNEITLIAPKIGGATKAVGLSTIAFPSSKPAASVTE